MNARLKIFLLSIFTIMTAACTSDADIDANGRTVDVTVNNMEQIASGVIDATYLSAQFLPIFSFLDANDLQDLNCVGGGSLTVNSSRQAGEAYSVGDRLSIDYNGCVLDDGRVFEGRSAVRYTEVNGLNHRFIIQNTAQCIDEITSELGSNVLEFENFESGEFYPADRIAFTQVGQGLDLSFLRFDSSGSTLELAPPIGSTSDQVSPTFIPQSQNAVVVLRSVILDTVRSTPQNLRYQLDTSVPASLTVDGQMGDQVYSVRNGEAQLENCQNYERRLVFGASNLSVTLLNGDRVSINGTLDLFETSEDVNVLAGVIENSNFSVTFVRGQQESVYSLIDYTASLTGNVSGQSLAFSAFGSVDSAAIDGRVDVSTNPAIRAFQQDLIPSSGIMNIIGRDLEAVNLLFQGETVELAVATEGDVTGSGRADINERLITLWQDLLDRNFVRANEQPADNE